MEEADPDKVKEDSEGILSSFESAVQAAPEEKHDCNPLNSTKEQKSLVHSVEQIARNLEKQADYIEYELTCVSNVEPGGSLEPVY